MKRFCFLSEHPLHTAGMHERLADIVRRLPSIIERGSEELRREIEALPHFDPRGGNELRMRALMRDYHFLQSAYVHAPPAVKTVPANIAVPSYLLAEALGRGRHEIPPVLSYGSAVLENWLKIDRGKKGSANPFSPIVTFTGTSDERGFLAVHMRIEEQAGTVLKEIASVKDYLRSDFTAIATRALDCMHDELASMNETLALMPRVCDPKVYHERVHQWYMPLSDVVFKGVARYRGEPQTFPGASGAQSPVMPALDAAFEIKHEHDEFAAYMARLQSHMLPEHRSFLDRFKEGPTLRALVGKHRRDSHLVGAYNRCVKRISTFRRLHSALARRYATAHKRAYGTGGTNFRPFLERYARDTDTALL